jgi:hypothetical protein
MCATSGNTAYLSIPGAFHQSREEFSMINRVSQCTETAIAPVNFIFNKTISRKTDSFSFFLFQQEMSLKNIAIEGNR